MLVFLAGLVVGLFVGAILGAFAMAACALAGQTDDAMDQLNGT